MKRKSIAAGLIATLALAATAIASSSSYQGTVRPGGTVTFDVRVHNGRIVKVTNFAFSAVPAMCDQPGPYYADISKNPLPPMRVNADNRFRGRFRIAGTSEKAHVRGVFKHHGRRARGHLRLNGDFGSNATNCNTGADAWRAHRG